MATLTLAYVVIPTFTSGLNTLSHILSVAEAHAKANGLDADAEYPSASLTEDMRPLSFQVQNATSTVRRTLARLTGTPEPVWEDKEVTLADLRARIAKAHALLKEADAAAVNARAEQTVDLPLGPTAVIKLSAQDSALKQGIPNFFFHLQTAYAILRLKGVPIGKKDYITSFLEVV
ncbi:hypothetical protein B0H63DRAFT_80189 [Podospora didyma]|uniref:Helix-turn-helix-domain containing protein type n=1 Tax=Podospora didyma TaxID=330526 RepID=A0AAE0N431_9PEZI|nr:hypothetical protein B0H63DRAFT_80189 [Podospora didyma]